ncbi:MAG: helix-turn-helix transcriptional regulator [Candidatus Aminicenantes bacterium]|nr:helix-turn-helix transcriptional regulator [Candidatus Aminicenantes bacterium]
MTPEELKKHLDVLELSPKASFSDIKNAYLRLRRLYGGTSIVLDPIAEEFSDKKRAKILQDIETAYAALLKAGREKPETTWARDIAPTAVPIPAAQSDAPPPADEPLDDLVFSGPVLRAVRESLGIELLEISKQLKLRGELLKSLEEERYEALPEEIYLKVHLKNVAACLRLKPAKVVDDYVARYREWKSHR